MRLFVLSALLLAAGVARGQGPATAERTRSDVSLIRKIKISRPNIEVTGSRLARVEIWIEPTGTGLGPALVGEARRITPAGTHETWIFPISSLPGYPHPVMAVNAFAKGFDRKGREVGTASLGINGVSDFNVALYSRIPD
jgi:hypothetical protein